MANLALCGGEPVRKELFPAYNTIGPEEKNAAARVLESGNLSQYLGVWHDDFMGGPEVRAFESAWAGQFGFRHALAVNSATSGLYAAVGACGVGPGDEIIVSPYTMSASAIAAAAYGAVPVFADISPTTFCMTAETIRERITPRTRAILIVHIFGHSADMDGIMALARQHGIKVIEDCAQAPGALYHGKPVGVLGDLGVFSLNYHKHIHTGEGGVVTTNDDELARQVSLIRNHAETVVEGMGRPDLAHLVGYNYRLTELQAAIGTEQLRKLPRLIEQRRENVSYLRERLSGVPGIQWAGDEEGCLHVYYVWAARFDAAVWGVHRNVVVEAIDKELPTAHLRETTSLIGAGYVRPLYWMPFYQQRTTSCSFNCPRYKGTVEYARGLCPVTERMHTDELFLHEYMRPGMRHADLDDVVRAFEKVWKFRAELQGKANQTSGK
jgi:dTDP-4-amino-4,6-dideoxygalactose transaminase